MRLGRLGMLLSFALPCSGCMTVFPVSATGKGCSGESADFFPSDRVVAARAPRDLACDGDVRVERRTDVDFTASGCGKELRYQCEADAVSGCSLEDAAEREGCEPLDESARLETGAG